MLEALKINNNGNQEDLKSVIENKEITINMVHKNSQNIII